MKHILTILLFLLITLPSSAIKIDSLKVNGAAQDAITKVFLSDYAVKIFAIDELNGETWVRTDTCRDIATTAEDEWMREYYIRDLTKRQRCNFTFALKPGRYRCVVQHELYEEAEQTFEVPTEQKGRRAETLVLKDFQLTRKAIKLGEAIVNSTRIKMTMKGDTVVYNAEAFQLAEGSMLDALVKMMPGLEIREGGKIYHDGQFVPELLLNGKDFFKGDPSVALKNLPAYTVKELRVYHKAPDGAYLRTNTLTDTLSWDKALDVRLKKEYNNSWLVSAEAAGGSPTDRFDQLYLARLLCMTTSERSIFAVYSYANNLSSEDSQNTEGKWTSNTAREGTKTVQSGGLNYTTETLNSKTKINTALVVRNSSKHVETINSTTTFLPTGDVFGRSRKDNHSDTFEGKWVGEVNHRGQKGLLMFYPSMTFFRNEWDDKNLAAQFSANPHEAYRGASLDSLFSTTGYVSQQSMADRLYITRNRDLAHSTNTGFAPHEFVYGIMKTPWLKNQLDIQHEATYNYDKVKTWDIYAMNHRSDVAGDYRNRYSTTPSMNFSTWNRLRYHGRVKSHFTYSVSYRYRKEIGTDDRNYYRLDRLGGEWETAEKPGRLPSMSDWQTLCIDAENTYNSRQNNDEHRFSADLTFRLRESSKNPIEINLIPAVDRLREHWEDTRSALPERQTLRHYTFFQPRATLIIGYKPLLFRDSTARKNARGTVNFAYSTQTSAPDGSYLLDVRDSTDPLRLTLGNPDLNVTRRHHANFRVRTTSPTLNWTFDTDFNITNGAVAQGMSYDAPTGVYTFRPENINGNWNNKTSLRLLFSPRNSPFEFTNNSTYGYTHSVDLINGARSVVDNHLVSQSLSATYTKGKITASLNPMLNWNYATSQREGYRTRSTFDISYNAEVVLNELFWGLNIATNLILLQRCGYDDATMNDNTLVWDAQISRALDHKKAWNLMLKGHDLLHQLSNVRRTINAQGLTETWTNSVPSYLMLHLSYRFNWQPKSMRN